MSEPTTTPTTHYIDHPPTGAIEAVPIPLSFKCDSIEQSEGNPDKWIPYRCGGPFRPIECPYSPGDVLAFPCRSCGGVGAISDDGCDGCQSEGTHRLRVVSVEAKRLEDATEQDAIDAGCTWAMELIPVVADRDGITTDSWYWFIHTEELT